MESNTRHSVITRKEASQKYNIGIKKMKDTFIVTTQKGIIHAVHPLYHRYIVDNTQLNRKCLNAQFYTDHLLGEINYLEGNTGAWTYTTEKFTVAYPCTKRPEVVDMLRWFSGDVEIPDRLGSYMAPEITVNIQLFRIK